MGRLTAQYSRAMPPSASRHLRRRRPLFVLIVVLLLTIMLAPVGVGAADTPESINGVQVLNVRQEDLTNDGEPDLTIIDAVIATPTDRVLVYDGGGNMSWSTNWADATDFSDDTWVFQIGGEEEPGKATLVIAFSTEDEGAVARIYDGTTTGGSVRYVILDGRAQVVEPAYPAMTIRAQGSWLNDDGTLNYNLSWIYDGPAAAREHAERFRRILELDGRPDAEGEMRATAVNGVPEYLWSTILADIPETERIPRSGIKVNSGRHRPDPPENAVFWPLLNRPDDPLGRNYFDTAAFLEVDWEKGQIGGFTFFGYPVEAGYHINTLDPLERSVLNPLSFENPMAYYDLAADRDGFPELFIRMAYTPPNDPYYVSGGPTSVPIQMVQYSWNQTNHPALLWDYKIDLAGRNPIETSVRLGDMFLEQIPYQDLPHWVVESHWDFGTFVAWETGDGYLSSEGIYDWSTLEGVQRYEGIFAGAPLSGGVESYTEGDINTLPESVQTQRDYIAGVTNRSPAEFYQSILVGFRGEYAEINDQADLYFSPVDGRLHLTGASHGVYNAGQRRRVEYRNLDDDPYIDSWQLYHATESVAQLVQTDGFLIHAEPTRVTLLKTDLERALFHTPPPADTEAWKQLGAQLDANKPEFTPEDFGAMIAQFEGAEMTITNATLRGYRPVGDAGFRFVLELQPGFHADGEALIGLENLEPGSYVVSYDGSFAVEPLTPPALSATVVNTMAPALTQSSVQITLRNAGLEDVPGATIELWAARPGEDANLVGSTLVDLLGATTMTSTVVWTPPTEGTWTVTPQILLANGQRLAFDPTQIRVTPAPNVSAPVLWEISTAPTTMLLALAGLGMLALLAALIVWQQTHTTAGGRFDDVG